MKLRLEGKITRFMRVTQLILQVKKIQEMCFEENKKSTQNIKNMFYSMINDITQNREVKYTGEITYMCFEMIIFQMKFNFGFII